jgi:PAS domain S-box-containing protein
MQAFWVDILIDLERTLSGGRSLENKLERLLNFSLDHFSIQASAITMWKKSWALSLLKVKGKRIARGTFQSRGQGDFEAWLLRCLGKESPSVLSLPILAHKGVKGWLGVATDRSLSKDARSFLSYLSAKIAFLTSEAISDTHSDREKRLVLINHIMMQLATSLRLEESISHILKSFLDFLGKKSGAIYLLNNNKDAFDLIAEMDFISLFEGIKHRINKDETWVSEVIRERNGNNIDRLFLLEPYKETVFSKKAHFILGRPIPYKGEEVCLFFTGSHRPFSKADIERIDFLTDQLILFIEHFYLYRRFKDIGRSLAEGRSIEEVSRLILDQVSKSIRASALWLMLYDPGTHMLEMMAYEGLEEKKYDQLRIAAGEGITGGVFTSQKSLFIPDIRSESNFILGRELKEEWIRSYLAVPLIYNGESIGVLGIFSPEITDDPFYEQEQIDLLTLSATQAAIAIQNARYAKELEELKLEWASAFDSIPDVICILDKNYRILKSNRALSTNFGVSVEEIFSQPCYRVLWNREEPCEECPHRETIETDLPSYKEWNHGSRTYLALTSPIQNTNGYTDKTVYFMKDVTEEKEKERQIQQYEKMAEVGTMVSKIAHDIRNPLGAIANSVSILEKFIDKEGTAGQLFNIAIDEVRRLKEMLTEFMEFAKIPKPKFQSVDLVAIVEEVLELLREDEAVVKGVVIQRQYDPTNRINCSLDPSMIKSALWNLVCNAAEAMRNTGTLEILLKPCDIDGKEGLEIQVKDTGKGIPKNIEDRIFEPFVTTKTKGTGLGLSIVYQIVTEHKGTIHIGSIPEGGTLATLRLPRWKGQSWKES